MRNSETKDSTTRFLIYSFIGLLILVSVCLVCSESI